MSKEDERKNDHNKNKQKIKSAQEEACHPLLRGGLFAQANANMVIPKRPRGSNSEAAQQSASQGTNPLSLEQGETGAGLLVSISISGKSCSPVAVQVNQNKPQSSKVARGRKNDNARGKNKGIVIREGKKPLGRKAKPTSLKAEPLPKKGTIVDSDLDRTSEDESDESDRDYDPDEPDGDDDPDGWT